MSFLAAGWLVLLVPWAAIVAWTFRRSAEERTATATFLWERDRTPALEQSKRRFPPAWIIAALLAMLMAIVALADPATAGRAARVTVLIDPSVSLAALREGRTTREVLIASVEQELREAGVRTELYIRLPGLRNSSAADFAAARGALFTARPTSGALEAAVAAAKREAGTVVVLTDQQIAVEDLQLIVRSPDTFLENVGIDFAVAVERPTPSLMVRLLNASMRTQATIEVRAGGIPTKHDIRLIPEGSRADFFFDLPTSPSDEVHVALVNSNDAMPLDDKALLVRSGGTAKLVLDGDVPAVAGRFAAAFAKARGDGDAATSIRLSTQADATSTAIIFTTDTSIAVTGEARLSAHPILRDVSFDDRSITSVAAAPAGDWTPIAWLGERPILCVSEKPTRLVWIGFELDPADLTSVVLLTNAVDWLTASEPAEWRGASPAAIGADWTPVALVDPNLEASPGRYLDAAGRAVSVYLPAVAESRGESRGDLKASLRNATREQRRSLRSIAAAIVVGLALLAAVLARGRRPNLDVPIRGP